MLLSRRLREWLNLRVPSSTVCPPYMVDEWKLPSLFLWSCFNKRPAPVFVISRCGTRRHPHEKVSEFLSLHFRTCITSSESPKVLPTLSLLTFPWNALPQSAFIELKNASWVGIETKGAALPNATSLIPISPRKVDAMLFSFFIRYYRSIHALQCNSSKLSGVSTIETHMYSKYKYCW